MLETIRDIIVIADHTVWYYINVLWHLPLLDDIMPYIRNQWTWAPLYLFLAVFMPLNFGRKGIMWCVFFILTFTLCDYASASIIKPYFHRVRPCNDSELAKMIHLLVPCGSGYSFPSSHAANHFGLAIFSAISLQHKIRKIWVIALVWAFAVAYAQVYVGVHFPLDVFCGGLIGCCIGILTGRVFNRIYHLNAPSISPPNQQST